MYNVISFNNTITKIMKTPKGHHIHVEQPTVVYPTANNLEILAQKCWKELDIEQKRNILSNMVDHFKFKSQYKFYKNQLTLLKTGQQIDRMASNLMLVDKDKVIR